jgi:hypothetical protein
VVREPEYVEFAPDDTAVVVERMRRLAADRDGWINFHPGVDDDSELPTVSIGLIGWLSARGPSVPEATWVPGEAKRKGVQRDSIGIQHPTGPKAKSTLADRGISIPEGWAVRADHPRRGLVLELPDGTDPDAIVDWLIRATTALSPKPLPPRWVGVVYRR